MILPFYAAADKAAAGSCLSLRQQPHQIFRPDVLFLGNHLHLLRKDTPARRLHLCQIFHVPSLSFHK